MRRASVLFESLVVLMILGLLALIAIPNYLENRVRANVALAKVELRDAAVALEAYAIDWEIYPYDGYNRVNTLEYNYWFLPKHLSTPVAYISDASVIDPFRVTESTAHWQWNNIRYICSESAWGTAYDEIQRSTIGRSTFFDDVMTEWGGWRVQSVGPDGYYGPAGPTSLFPGAVAWEGVSNYPACPQPYDPTNGSISWGDIIVSHKSSNGYLNIE